MAKINQHKLTPEAASKQSREINKYIRDKNSLKLKNIQDKKLKRVLRTAEEKARNAALKAAQSELFLPAVAGSLEADDSLLEKTWKFTQPLLKEEVDLSMQRKMKFNLKLNDFGPYSMDYTRNGRFLLIGGLKGHLAAFDWQQGRLACELHLRETIRAVSWLHNDTMFAVSQKKYTYIYDKTGMEIHCLKDHIEVNCLEFLPYHFLLASVGNAGYLKYQDTSTGQLVAQHKTKLGQCNAMAQNPYNAIINLGHANGTVTLWSPSMTEPLVKIQCHKGPVKAMTVDRSGKYLATTGLDGQLKIWDIRLYKEVDAYFTPTPASSLTFSDKGLLAVGYGPRISVWKDTTKSKQKEPYMTHLLPGSSVSELKFCPFEDILGAGHSKGFSSIVVPGSGEPNFDTFEANPYQTKKQRQESEVHSLLDKLQPEMITLDPSFVGKMDMAPVEVIKEEAKLEWEANHPGEKFVPVKRARGKSSSQRRYLRKQGNVVDEKRIELKEKLEAAQKERDIVRKKSKGEYEEKPRTALDRFSF